MHDLKKLDMKKCFNLGKCKLDMKNLFHVLVLFGSKKGLSGPRGRTLSFAKAGGCPGVDFWDL